MIVLSKILWYVHGRINQLIDDIPDYKLVFVVEMLESLRAYAGETIKPDEWDLKMIEQAQKENDGEAITIDELAKELGIMLYKLQK